MYRHKISTYLFALVLATFATFSLADDRITALIIEGQNNHRVWPKTTKMMKAFLEEKIGRASCRERV